MKRQGRKQKVIYLGLNEHHRVSWQDGLNQLCCVFAQAGMHVNTIAKRCHMTPNQVRYRCMLRGIHVSDYRNGEGPLAMALFAKYEKRLNMALKLAVGKAS